jgi:HSP20 family molecular chaperone IbpA
MEPKIEVKTSGEYKKLEPEIKRRLGVKPGVEEVSEEEEEVEKKVRIPKVTEEPEAEIKNLGNKQIISIKLPDVKSKEDIEVKKLEQSMEIKAFAGDKAYFKLIPLPANASIVKKEFKNGVLKIEVER